MTGVSTGSRGRVGTRQRILEVSVAPWSPGTLAPSVMTVDTRVPNRLAEVPPLLPLSRMTRQLNLSFPMRWLDTESWCLARAL